MKKIILAIILILLAVNLFAPLNDASAFSLMEKINSSCIKRGDCTVCDGLMILFNAARFIFISMSGIALIMMLWAGSGLIMNWGSAETITQNKKIILHTLLAILIILLAWTLVNAVFLFLAGDITENKFWTSGGKWWVAPKCN
ncbi:hypothetical protein COV56_03445 [Candidatus Kuenenbacteria bacterium CG11_big_fil_rev_8_21_14_0_20_37_9]|uniref:Uncharacterized protein n=2 Tax=Candidatus Kueneniibacteriota TaxID=1752740 RepID=A0A2M6XSI7_9BACT|nr:MAG: hypothetical protein AUJ29_02715 [Candidatus Kuenenbacteria bacterium CG1_02_38_13]PIR05316.1 MAG: hypothetical protein COV56_03445 [Candidatus Kuenenbacteria bacterium CG11_big_fil_rev_8_21_14_0_20_37_9]PIU10602.1 MAG: hypothetical protein COT27_02270 [Candidatus Kuenenbacteria bacterium CG08_land_8_20_14_0_20_37_23]